LAEDAISQMTDLLDKLDISRIDHNLTWAKQFIQKIEATGTVFKKSAFGEHLPEVHIAIYEALCCVPYLAHPEQRTTFQYVFSRLQGKSYLKLGTKDPLPGMTYFLFDHKNEDRRRWAHENWKNIDAGSITEEQFDWAIGGGLIMAIDDINRRDALPTTQETFEDIERFWLGFEKILNALNDDIIAGRLRSLEVRPGSPNIYDLLFRHIQFCKSEGVLVVTIRILTALLKKSPKAFWDVVGDARPNVIADLICASPVYHSLLRQSLEDCWSGFESGPDAVPFPTSWIDPWLQSVSRDRRYDACEVLMHTLFETLARDPSIGEPGQAACIRAGFDALNYTMETFLDSETKLGSGTTHLYANGTFNLVMRHKNLVLKNFHAPSGSHEGWSTFHVARAARNVMKLGMRLDMKLFSEEYHSLHNDQKVQSAITRESQTFWEGVVEMFDTSSQQATLAEDFLWALEPLVGVEQIRPRKKDNHLSESSKLFNKAYSGTADVLARIFSRVSELDTMDLNNLLASRFAFQVAIGISMHGESDVAEAASELLKSWTGELSRSVAFEQISQLHTDQTLGSISHVLERVLKPPHPWDPIRPLLHMSRDVLRGLSDPSSGVLRVRTLDSRSISIVIRWWQEQWMFVSKACRNIEYWSFYIPNATMTEFCREIMELAEALIAEDGLITSVSAKARAKSEKEMMEQILKPAKENFRGMENMIRLKDRWLVDVTVRVLCKILKRLLENNLEVAPESRKLILDACLPTKVPGKYVRATNLTDQQRAELLQALGHVDEEVQAPQSGTVGQAVKKQSKLDAWSKSGSSTVTEARTSLSNRDDVMSLSKSIDSPILKKLEAQKAHAKAKAEAKARAEAKAKTKVLDAKAVLSIKESRQREKAEKAKRDAEIIAKAKKLRGETVPGEGSGLASLALTGKDHSKSEIMVDSSEESDLDDESDGENQLDAITTGGKKTMDAAEQRRHLLLREQRKPVKKIKQQRSVKEMRARLIPPMDRLHNTLLAWDIFHQGNDPPSGPSGSEVATKYADPRSYQETFFPLLASEAWRSFVTAKDEITAKPFGMKIASRASIDSFLEVTFTMPKTENRERGVFEGDIILVSEAENPLNDPTAKHCLARIHRITYKKDLVEVTYRVASRNNPLSVLLNPGANVHGVKITNMTTIEREYAALESLQYYDLMDEVLKAEPSPIIRYGDEKISRWMENWTLNRGQALAVLGAQENDGFTLIQG
jgi:senataxin